MLASMIFLKEPFFHGQDNYDQVTYRINMTSVGKIELVHFPSFFDWNHCKFNVKIILDITGLKKS